MSLLDFLPSISPRNEQQTADYSVPLYQKPSHEITSPDKAAESLARNLNAYAEFQRQKESFNDDASVEQDLVADICHDAFALTSSIIPRDVAAQIEVPNEPTAPYVAASLSDLYLLARAYDATKDDGIKLSLEYVLYDTPPALSEYVVEAYRRSLKNETLIMDEHQLVDLEIANRYAASTDEPF